MNIDLKVSEPAAFGQATAKLQDFKLRLIELLELNTVFSSPAEFRDICLEESKKFVEENKQTFIGVELLQLQNQLENLVRIVFTSVTGYRIELTVTIRIWSTPIGSDISQNQTSS